MSSKEIKQIKFILLLFSVIILIHTWQIVSLTMKIKEINHCIFVIGQILSVFSLFVKKYLSGVLI